MSIPDRTTLLPGTQWAESDPDVVLEPVLQDVVMSDDNGPLSLSESFDMTEFAIPLAPILRLPAELRARILYFCFKQPKPISWPMAQPGPQGLPVSLLRTCKTLYHESADTLYQRNTLLFRHPSDCNMFLYMYNYQQAQKVRRLLLHVTDREVSLWTAYLSSNTQHRSITNDYPNLEELYIVLKSSIMLSSPHHNLLEAYKKWETSKALLNLVASLHQRADAFKIKVLFVRYATREDERLLLQECPGDFVSNSKDTKRLRSAWRSLYGCEVALDATEENNPWATCELF